MFVFYNSRFGEQRRIRLQVLILTIREKYVNPYFAKVAKLFKKVQLVTTSSPSTPGWPVCVCVIHVTQNNLNISSRPTQQEFWTTETHQVSSIKIYPSSERMSSIWARCHTSRRKSTSFPGKRRAYRSDHRETLKFEAQENTARCSPAGNRPP